MTEITHQTPGRYCDLMKIDEVQDLEYGMDFRRPEYRREVFLRFYEFHLKYRAHPGGVYFLLPWLTGNLSAEEKLWFGFINGNTQNPVTSWLIFEEFRNLSNLHMGELELWFNHEYNRLEFDTDRRYHKKDFLKSVECYRRNMGSLTQQSFFEPRSNPIGRNREHLNFQRLWHLILNNFHSFGRLSAFSYLEYLRILGVELDCDQLFLEDMSGSKSHRNGLAKVLGRDDLDWHDSNPTEFEGKYTKEVLNWLKVEGARLLEEARLRFEERDFIRDVSYFTLESTFCTFKSWFRPNRRYPGVYLDMMHGRIKKAEEKWPEKKFDTFWAARKEYLPPHLRLEDNPGDPGLSPKKQNHFRTTGQVIMMDKEWACFRNSFNR